MELALGAKLGGLGLFLLLVALAASAQACLFHINRARLRSLSEQGGDRAQGILRALERPGFASRTVTALSTVSVAGATAFTFLTALDLADGGPAPFLFAAGMLALAVLLQTLARGLAIARPESTALRIYRPVAVLATLLAPLMMPLRSLEHRILGLFGATAYDPHSAEEELRQLVEAGEDGGVLEQDERQMIHAIFELSQVTAREVMVPRIYVEGVSDDALVEQVLDLIISTGHSRVPIYEGSIDNIVGIVYAKDVLKHLKGGQLGDPVRSLARPAYFVPEAKKVDELLEELQQRRVHIAVVVDEYGGTAGLITIEDLLEEIVGEIRDEYDQAEEPRVERVNDCEAILDARVTIREVNDLLALDLPDDEFDTLGGLVYDSLGKVPAIDDEVRVNGCLIRVVSTEGRRIKKLRLVVGDAPRP